MFIIQVPPKYPSIFDLGYNLWISMSDIRFWLGGNPGCDIVMLSAPLEIKGGIFGDSLETQGVMGNPLEI